MSEEEDMHGNPDKNLDKNLDGNHEELREAEALAHAMERGSATEDLPDDAFQTAAMLRYSAAPNDMDPARSDAVLKEVLEVSDKVAARAANAPPEPSAWGRWSRWLFGAIGVSAVTALVLLFVFRDDSVALPTPLPAVTTDVVAAQLARVSGSGEQADARFDGAMGTYRQTVYAALRDRYQER